MGKYDDKPYEVGKGKPPKKTRWKAGQSGNPKGPRRRARLPDLTLRQILAEIVNEPVAVTIGGRESKIPKKYAILLGIVHDGLNGTAHQRMKAFEAINKLGVFDLLPSDQGLNQKERDQAMYDVVAQLAAEAERDLARFPDYPPDEALRLATLEDLAAKADQGALRPDPG
jgi:hypothetical protein